MKDTKEIVLLFKDKSTYDVNQVINEISSRYHEIGDAKLFKASDGIHSPLFIFNENQDLIIYANYKNVNIIVNHNNFAKLSSIIFDIVDTFEEFNCYFIRMGCASNNYLAPSYIEKFKKRFLKDVKDIEDMGINWYRKIKYKYGYLNCWQRYITDQFNFKDLLCQHDINTLIDEEIKIDMKFIKEFIGKNNEIVEEGINI